MNNKKRSILFCLLILIMLIIFSFSNQKGSDSNKTSDIFTGAVIDKVTNVANKEISEQKRNSLILKSRLIVRKSAHFFLYFVLGGVVYLLLKSYNIKRSFLISIAICFIFAGTDEIHQSFLADRTASFGDCIIDTLGSTASIFILKIIEKKKKRKVAK